MHRLILLASPTLRRGPLSPLQRFVRDYQAFLTQFDIVTTEGCRVALSRSGLLLNHPNFEAPMPGYMGGIVQLLSMVVNEPTRVEAVIYLIDPRDPSSIFPETNAIKRECVVHGVTFLSTSRAAREWAAMKWGASLPQFVTSVNADSLPLVRPLDQETIALIAHDGKKRELLEFARNHFEFLLRFRQRVATGTTGSLLNGSEPPKRLGPEECAELSPVCGELRALIDEARKGGGLKEREQFVTEKQSGPKGGDIMIAQMVLDGDCQRIVFFENPLKPHEHTEDIQLLERTGRLRGKSTICVHDQKTAAEFVHQWETASRAVDQPRMLLSFVLEHLFDAKCILAESKDDWQETWDAVREAASWFLLSHIATLAHERKKVSENVRVSVSWGLGSSKIVEEMESRLSRLASLDRSRPARQTTPHPDLDDVYTGRQPADRYFQTTTTLADQRYFQPGNVVVAPIQGLVGSEVEEVEANEIAHRLKELFRGLHVPLAANSLVRRGGDTERRRKRFEDAYSHWENTDVVLVTAGPLVEQYPGRPRTPHFPGFISEMKTLGACGNVGPVFLDQRGREVVPNRFESTSMSADQLKQVRNRGGVVLVAGAQQERANVTLAALIGGWVSVLVTDTEFAKNLVDECSRLAAEGHLKLLPPDNVGPLVESAR